MDIKSYLIKLLTRYNSNLVAAQLNSFQSAVASSRSTTSESDMAAISSASHSVFVVGVLKANFIISIKDEGVLIFHCVPS